MIMHLAGSIVIGLCDTGTVQMLELTYIDHAYIVIYVVHVTSIVIIVFFHTSHLIGCD